MSVMYSMPGLLLANAAFGLSDVVAMIVCGQSNSLNSFFQSSYYEVYTFIDTLKNLFYSGLLAFYGLKLIMKFYRYSSIELSERLFADREMASGTDHSGRVSGSNKASVFSTALYRLTVVLAIATVSFFIRVFMLVLKTAALHTDTTVSSPTAPLFGFLWFTFSDFIPRCLPSFALVYLMKAKKRSVRRDYTSSNRTGGFASRRSLATSLDPYSGKFSYDAAADGEDFDSDSEYSGYSGASGAEWGHESGSGLGPITPNYEEEFDDDDDGEEVVFLDNPVSRRSHTLHGARGGSGGGGALASLVPLGTAVQQQQQQRGGGDNSTSSTSLPSKASNASLNSSSMALFGKSRVLDNDEISLTSFTSLVQIGDPSSRRSNTSSPPPSSRSEGSGRKPHYEDNVTSYVL
jgi:hypothetical protein